MLLVVDNGSIFTKNLSDFLYSQQIQFDLLSFDKVNLNSISQYDYFILSGRKSNDSKMNSINSKLIQYSVNESKNLLGICYGAELIALTLGGTIRRMNTLQKGNENISITHNNPLASNTIQVYESHHYELSKLGSNLISIASSKNCTHEIVQHKTQKIFGTQFHPEMTLDGHELIKKFLQL